jgi:hypothetical protein
MAMRESMQAEPIRVSARFHTAIITAAMKLETQAAWDERHIDSFQDEDQRRRQMMLVDAQLMKAFKLREMLDQMQVRDADEPPVYELRPLR